MLRVVIPSVVMLSFVNRALSPVRWHYQT